MQARGEATVHVVDSTFERNEAAQGSAIHVTGALTRLTLENSRLFDNVASEKGTILVNEGVPLPSAPASAPASASAPSSALRSPSPFPAPGIVTLSNGTALLISP